jgi:hypothetical protein
MIGCNIGLRRIFIIYKNYDSNYIFFKFAFIIIIINIIIIIIIRKLH